MKMSFTRTKICELLAGTVLVSLITPALLMGYMIIENWHGGEPLGHVVVAFFYGSLMGLITMGIFIVPCAFLVSLVMAWLKGWSLRAVAAILLTVVVCCSLVSLILDPMRSREQASFNVLVPVATKFNVMGILTGFAAAIIAFWVVQRCRKRIP